MKNNKNTILRRMMGILLLFVLAVANSAADLDSVSHRTDRWEASFQIRYLDSIDIGFTGGAEANLNAELGWSLGMGYNFSENWAFNFDIGWSDIGYSGTRIDSNGTPETVSGTLFTSSSNFSAIYNFSAKRFTPFVGTSIGWTFVDTNIPDGLPQTACWYDPWWGYVCDTYVPTRTSTEFSYGAVVGLRFDVKNNLFFKTSIGKQWMDFGSATSTPDFTIYRFDVGVMF